MQPGALSLFCEPSATSVFLVQTKAVRGARENQARAKVAVVLTAAELYTLCISGDTYISSRSGERMRRASRAYKRAPHKLSSPVRPAESWICYSLHAELLGGNRRNPSSLRAGARGPILSRHPLRGSSHHRRLIISPPFRPRAAAQPLGLRARAPEAAEILGLDLPTTARARPGSGASSERERERDGLSDGFGCAFFRRPEFIGCAGAVVDALGFWVRVLRTKSCLCQ